MADQTQTLANHRRYLPWWHFFAFPIMLGNIFVMGDRIYKYGLHKGTGWDLIFAVGLFLAVFASRTMTLRVQDRVIRLEMTLRLTALLSEPLRSRIKDLTPSQMIGLRFASDGEMTGLVEQCLSGGLANAEAVKKQIKNWVPDNLRA